jgi:hypothetical protein
MSNPINKLKEKNLTFKVGYIFFLLLGIVGLSNQMYKYLTGTLVLVSKEYKVNPELILASLFIMFIFRPMGLVEIIVKCFQALTNLSKK